MKRTALLVLAAIVLGGWWTTTQPRYCDHFDGMALRGVTTSEGWERACLQWSSPLGTPYWRLR